MKVCIITETYPPEVNGVAMTLHRIGEGLERLGHPVSIVRPKPAGHCEHPPKPNETRVFGIPLPGYSELRTGWFCGKRLVRDWRKDRPDVLYVATEGPLGRSAIWAGLKLGIPVTSGFHTNFHEYMKHYKLPGLKKWMSGMLRKVHNKTLCTFAPSNDGIEELNRLGIHNPRLLSRGVDTGLFNPGKRNPGLRKSWGLDSDQQVAAVFVSRIAAEKNIPLVVKAFRRIRERHPDAACVFVGDGPEGIRLAKENPDFIFAGMKRGEELAAHYASGDLFVFPSTTETFGNVVTEALASGLVTVAYNYAAPQQHIRHGENGFVADFDNESAYLAATDEALDSKDGWPEIRNAARATARTLSWDGVVERFAEDLEWARNGATNRVPNL